jgi:hypothetical protein
VFKVHRACPLGFNVWFKVHRAAPMVKVHRAAPMVSMFGLKYTGPAPMVSMFGLKYTGLLPWLQAVEAFRFKKTVQQHVLQVQ